MKLSWHRFKFLGISFLILFVFFPVLVFGINKWDEGWQISSGETKILDLTPIGVGKICVKNNSGSGYFIPTRTYPEWASFSTAMARLNVVAPGGGCCGDGFCNIGYKVGCIDPYDSTCETPLSCWADCAPRCDYQPSGVYASVLYTALTNCGGTPTCIPTYPPAVQAGRPYGTSPSPLPSIGEGQENGGCGILKIQRSSKCASLIRPPYYMCEGDPCVTGMQAADFRTPSFCVGTYDSLINTCIYRSRDNRSIGWGGSAYIDTYPSFNHNLPGFENFFITSPVSNNGAVGSWGRCYTQVPCGDGVCSTGYGETCASCSSDCGACAVVCGDYSCNGTEDCSNCSTDCGACICSNYYDESSCPSSSNCYWDYNSYSCRNSACQSAYDQYECQYLGCTWDSYGYFCY